MSGVERSTKKLAVTIAVVSHIKHVLGFDIKIEFVFHGDIFHQIGFNEA